MPERLDHQRGWHFPAAWRRAPHLPGFPFVGFVGFPGTCEGLGVPVSVVWGWAGSSTGDLGRWLKLKSPTRVPRIFSFWPA